MPRKKRNEISILYQKSDRLNSEIAVSPIGMADKEEWFDIVDEADRVIGKALRKEVHAKRLRHRAIHVFVFNEEEEDYLRLLEICLM